jgi:hypothetical protein
MESIEQKKQDVVNWEKIKRILTIYIHDKAIPHYKGNKEQRYVAAMSDFSTEEISCAEKQLECWGDFKKMTDLYRTQ